MGCQDERQKFGDDKTKLLQRKRAVALAGPTSRKQTRRETGGGGEVERFRGFGRPPPPPRGAAEPRDMPPMARPCRRGSSKSRAQGGGGTPQLGDSCASCAGPPNICAQNTLCWPIIRNGANAKSRNAGRPLQNSGPLRSKPPTFHSSPGRRRPKSRQNWPNFGQPRRNAAQRSLESDKLGLTSV